MTESEFEDLLNSICSKLTNESRLNPFPTSRDFENRVRSLVQEESPLSHINFDPHPQAFPDIAVGFFGIEVKFTTNDTWRSVANSVLETNRITEVKKVYLVFGKMGGVPEAKWGEYEKCVMHVRTSHVPRFEVEMSASESLFDLMHVPYDQFRALPMHEKMEHIRVYARSRLKQGERLWWLEDNSDSDHTLPIQARLYTKLTTKEKTRLRAEAALLCPQIVQSGRSRNKYDDAVLYLLTYRGVLCHQARDLFSAGSVANPNNDDQGGIYIQRSLQLLEADMLSAALELNDELFIEYWEESVPKEARIKRWLEKADALVTGWKPSESLFLENTTE